MVDELIRIRPKKGAKIFGDRDFSGVIKGASGEEYRFISQPFRINGHGVLLNLANPEEKKYWDVCQSKTVSKIFNKQSGINYRFDIENLAKDMQDYLTADETKTELKGMVMKMKGLELRTLGFFFGIRGSDNIIKGGIYKLIDDKKNTDKVGTFLLHKNRSLLNYIYNGLEQGNQSKQTGLYKNDRNIYCFNTSVIGNSEDEVIGYLKGDSEEAKMIYGLLKKGYEETQAEMNIKK